jgi:hypothetical protein
MPTGFPSSSAMKLTDPGIASRSRQRSSPASCHSASRDPNAAGASASAASRSSRQICRFRDGDGLFERASGPAPDHTSYSSFAAFSDPDENGWLLQEVSARLPGRVDPDWPAWYGRYMVAGQTGAELPV